MHSILIIGFFLIVLQSADEETDRKPKPPKNKIGKKSSRQEVDPESAEVCAFLKQMI